MAKKHTKPGINIHNLTTRKIGFPKERLYVRHLTLIKLLIINLIPVLGILFLDWKIFYILFFYWLENIVVGIFFVSLGILNKLESGSILKHLSVYSVVAFLHGFMIFNLFGADVPGLAPGLSGVLYMIKQPAIMISLIVLLLSYYCLFAMEQYRLAINMYKRGGNEILEKPMVRIIVLHLVLILSVAFVKELNLPALSIVILAIAKFFYESSGVEMIDRERP
jgi:hypothetical protein